MKNRNRSQYTFANINLLGKCNADCFFCLGKDIAEHLTKHDQTKDYFPVWKNFYKFLDRCDKLRIRKIYITGQNTDALCYKYLKALINYLQVGRKFDVGIRTNGKLALDRMKTIHQCRDEIGISINALSNRATKRILGWNTVPDFDEILSQLPENKRVSIVVCRANVHEIGSIIKLAAKHNCRYVQLRRISTDTRKEELAPEMKVFDELEAGFADIYTPVAEYETATIYNVYGINVSFWSTVATTANSINYFTDGIISDEYFVVEGYLKNLKGERNG